MCSNAMNARQATRTDSAPQIELPLCPLFNDQFSCGGWPLRTLSVGPWTRWPTCATGNQFSLDHFMLRFPRSLFPVGAPMTMRLFASRTVRSLGRDDPGNCLEWRIGHACPCADDAHRKSLPISPGLSQRRTSTERRPVRRGRDYRRQTHLWNGIPVRRETAASRR